MKILLVYNTMEYVWLRRKFIAALQERGHSVAAIGPFDGWEERVRELDVECLHVNMTRRGMNPLRELRTIFELARLFRRVKPDATILYTIKPITYGAIAARFAGLARSFAVITGLGYMFAQNGVGGALRRQAAKLIYGIALKSIERVFFQNQDDYDLFLRGKIVRREQALRVAGSGVDTGWFRPPDHSPDNPSFVLISRMLWDKGIGVYVEAARALRQRHPGLTFGVVGAPDDNPAGVPRSMLEQWHDEGTIRYYGYVEDIRPILGRASVYVLPSHYREGVPRTNLEALAMGKAIITTDMPGCRETVENGVNGILVPPRDAAALESAMETFVDDPTLGLRMGRASRRLAKERFEQSVVNERFIEVLEGSATVPEPDATTSYGSLHGV